MYNLTQIFTKKVNASPLTDLLTYHWRTNCLLGSFLISPHVYLEQSLFLIFLVKYRKRDKRDQITRFLLGFVWKPKLLQLTQEGTPSYLKLDTLCYYKVNFPQNQSLSYNVKLLQTVFVRTSNKGSIPQCKMTFT